MIMCLKVVSISNYAQETSLELLPYLDLSYILRLLLKIEKHNVTCCNLILISMTIDMV